MEMFCMIQRNIIFKRGGWVMIEIALFMVAYLYFDVKSASADAVLLPNNRSPNLCLHTADYRCDY